MKQKEQQERNLILGVDPSFSNFGMAIYDPEKKKILDLKTTDFHSAIKWLNEKKILSRSIAIVENAALDSTTFKMWGMVQSELQQFSKYTAWQKTRSGKPPTHKTINDVRSKFSIAMTVAQKVGEVKAASKLIIKLFAEHGVPVLEVAPSKRDNAKTARSKAGKAKVMVQALRYPTKMNAEEFKRLTGWDKSSNEHNRDACTLAWNRRLSDVHRQISIQEIQVKKKPKGYPSQKNYNKLLIDKNKPITNEEAF